MLKLSDDGVFTMPAFRRAILNVELGHLGSGFYVHPANPGSQSGTELAERKDADAMPPR